MKNYVSINANDVKKMFKVCGACLDTSGARECLQYIKIEIRGNKATAIGCDGFRLATVTFDTITKDGADFDFFVKPAKIDKKAMLVSFTINDDKSVTMSDGATSITTRYLANYIEWERVFEMSKPKQPAQIGINAKMLAEILNAIKDYGDNKRVVITIDADSATRPVFIETPDGLTKTMLCTCRNK